MIENPQPGDRVRVIDGEETLRETFADVRTGELGTVDYLDGRGWAMVTCDGKDFAWALRYEDVERVEEPS